MLALALNGESDAYEVVFQVLHRNWKMPDAWLLGLTALGLKLDSQRATFTAWFPYGPNTDRISLMIACVLGVVPVTGGTGVALAIGLGVTRIWLLTAR